MIKINSPFRGPQRKLRKNEVYIEVEGPPDELGKSSMLAHWRTDYIPGQPYSPKFELLRGQVFVTELDDWITSWKMRHPRSIVTVIKLWLKPL